jgi:hypothetical protein
MVEHNDKPTRLYRNMSAFNPEQTPRDIIDEVVATMEYNIIPPLPPLMNYTDTALYLLNMPLVPGEFNYVDENERDMFANAWQAITLTETWDFIKNFQGSFMISDDANINRISAKMSDLGYDGHSGCSFGFTMQTMKYIAINGEEKFREDYIIEG